MSSRRKPPTSCSAAAKTPFVESSPIGREWPKDIESTYHGYSIGRWGVEDANGRYTVLEVETRGFKGPRAYDATGLPLHFDNQSIFKERLHLDKSDPNVL